jgi:hypothetical protein
VLSTGFQFEILQRALCLQEAYSCIPGILSANPLLPIGILNAYAAQLLESKMRGLAQWIRWNPERQYSFLNCFLLAGRRQGYFHWSIVICPT